MSNKIPPPSKLIQAIRSGNPSSVAAALDDGADIEEPDMHGCTGLPLRTACFTGNLAVIRELLQRGAQVDAAAHDGPSAALRLALRRGNEPLAALLLQHGATIPPGVQIPPRVLEHNHCEPLVPKAEGPLAPLDFQLDEPTVSAPSETTPDEPEAALETDAPGQFGEETRLISMDILFLDDDRENKTPEARDTAPREDEAEPFWKSGQRIIS